MKYVIALLICCCTVMALQAQSKATAGRFSTEFPFIDQPVVLFKDSLICKDASHLDLRYDEYPACRSFLVSPSSTIYRYGTVDFNSVFIFPDSAGIVNSFSHFKSFMMGEKKSRAAVIVALSRYFNAKCEMLPVAEEVKGKYSDHHTLTWRKDGIKVIVMVSYHKNRKKGQLSSILSLDILKE